MSSINQQQQTSSLFHDEVYIGHNRPLKFNVNPQAHRKVVLEITISLTAMVPKAVDCWPQPVSTTSFNAM